MAWSINLSQAIGVGSPIAQAVVASLALAGAAPTVTVGGGGSWQLPSANYVNSPYVPLKIVAPWGGLSTTNAYYKHYAGIAFERPAVVQGGAYPYLFTLTGAPTGMTIGQIYGVSNYGIITWANPLPGTYNLTLTVQDQTGLTVQVSWSLLVDQTSAVFVAGNTGSPSIQNGGTGTGTQAKPFQTFDDIWSGSAGHSGTSSARKADTTHTNKFVYILDGTLTTAQSWVAETGLSGRRVPMVSNAKPKVWMGIPGGNTVTLDSTGSFLHYYSNSAGNVWFGFMNAAGMDQGDTVNPPLGGAGKWVASDAGVTDFGFYKINYQTPTWTATGGTNPAMFMIVNNGAANYLDRWYVKNCTYQDLLNHEGVEMYPSRWGCFHDNILYGNNSNVWCYPKLGGQQFMSFRGNYAMAAASTGRGFFGPDNYDFVTDCEVCYNFLRAGSGGGCLYFGPDGGGTGVQRIASFRNCYVGPDHMIQNIPVTNFQSIGDVFVFSNASADAHGFVLTGGGTSTTPTFTNQEGVGLNNGALDSNGNLQGAFLQYLGTRGAQIHA